MNFVQIILLVFMGAFFGYAFGYMNGWDSGFHEGKEFYGIVSDDEYETDDEE